MAGRISGVTIEFGGQTIKLEKALKNVNGQVKLTQKELTDVNKLLKFDPKNSELLVQKQNLLKESLNASKKKLEELKAIEQELAKDPGQKDKWQIIRREIIDTEKSVKFLSEEQSKLNKKLSLVGKLSAGYDEIASKSENAGKKLLPLTAGIAGVSVASYKAWNEVDEMLDIIVTKTGASGEQLLQLQEISKEVFQSEVVPSATDAGNAVGELNTRFGFTGEILQNSSIDFLKFAQITGQDVNNAIIKVSRAMGDAGIDSKNYVEVLDALTVAGQQSGIEVGNLTETLTKFGAPMRQLGFDTKESIALFSSWEKAGVNTEIAFSGMKKAIGNWAKEGKDAKVEFRKMLEEIKNAPTLAEATTKALEVFGQKAGPDLADAIKGGRFEFSEMLNSIEKSGGSLAETFKNTQAPIDKFKQAFNQLKIVGAEFADVALQMLLPVFKAISGITKTLVGWFNGLSETQKKVIIALTGLAGSISLILIAFAKFMFFLKKVYDAFKLVKTAITVFKKAMIGLKAFLVANPFVIWAIGIGLVIGAFVLAYKKCEWFRNGVNKVVKQIGEAFKKLYSNYVKPALDFIMQKWTQVRGFFIQLGAVFSQIFTSIWGGILTAWNVFWSSFSPIFKSAWEFIKTYFSNLWVAIKAIWDIFAGLFTGDWQRVWNGIKDFISAIWENIKLIFSTALNILWEVIKSIFTAIWNTIVSIFNQIPTFFSNIWNTAKNTVSTLLNTIWTTIVNLSTSIYNSVAEWFGKIPDKIKEIWNTALDYLKGINLVQVGKDIIWGMINGIGSMGSYLWEAAKNIGSQFVSSIKSFFGIASPSKLMKGFGVNIGEGLEIGVKDKLFDIAKSGKNLANAFNDGYKSQSKHFKQSLNLDYEINSNSGVISGLNKNLNKISSLNQNFKVDVPVILNGREIARATNQDSDYYHGLKMKRLRSV